MQKYIVKAIKRISNFQIIFVIFTFRYYYNTRATNKMSFIFIEHFVNELNNIYYPPT